MEKTREEGRFLAVTIILVLIGITVATIIAYFFGRWLKGS